MLIPACEEDCVPRTQGLEGVGSDQEEVFSAVKLEDNVQE